MRQSCTNHPIKVMMETLILSYKLVIEVLSVFVSMNIIVSTSCFNNGAKVLLYRHLSACKITEKINFELLNIKLVFYFESLFFLIPRIIY